MSASGARTRAPETWGDERAAQLLTAVLAQSPRTIAELGQALSLAADELQASLAVLAGHGLIAVDERTATVSPGRAALRFARSGKGGTICSSWRRRGYDGSPTRPVRRPT